MTMLERLMRDKTMCPVSLGLGSTLFVITIMAIFLSEMNMTVAADQQIKPFLAIPLAKDAPHELSQGWDYSEDERKIHPEIPRHYGVDFKAPWGTPVYAPTDGMAVASYHTFMIKSAAGQPIGFGLGLFVQIWHEEAKLYSMYAHLAEINEKLVPYIPPVRENGAWQPRKALYVPVEQFKKQAKIVKRGDLLGKIGFTGLFAYKEGIAYELEKVDKPPVFDPKQWLTWDPHGAHLHWEVYTRSTDGGKKETRLDPFGIYAKREKYGEVFKKAQGLILGGPDGTSLFAR